jgi:hypothetical protein
MIHLLLNILPYQNSDEIYIIFFNVSYIVYYHHVKFEL